VNANGLQNQAVQSVELVAQRLARQQHWADHLLKALAIDKQL
jgi:hypothetical protein